MNNDLISREALKKAIKEKLGIYIDGTFNNRLLFDIIDNAPTIEPEKAKESELIKAYTKGFDTGVEAVKNERPKGEWIKKQVTPASCTYVCSECGIEEVILGNFCCWCGADMRKGSAE